jgi:hypothetical protein
MWSGTTSDGEGQLPLYLSTTTPGQPSGMGLAGGVFLFPQPSGGSIAQQATSASLCASRSSHSTSLAKVSTSPGQLLSHSVLRSLAALKHPCQPITHNEDHPSIYKTEYDDLKLNTLWYDGGLYDKQNIDQYKIIGWHRHLTIEKECQT